jgi:hypothetical protein
MPTTPKVATILAGEWLSDAIDLSSAVQVYICTPTAWDAANVTFQASLDGGVTWFDYFGTDNNEVMLAMGGTLGTMGVLREEIPKNAQIKFRSGTRTKPVSQSADREFTVYVVT